MKSHSPRNLFRGICLVLAGCGLFSLAGCGGGTGTQTTQVPPTVSVMLQPVPPKTMGITGVTRIGAVVSNDSSNGGVSWSCAPAGSCGSFGTSTTASGAYTMYTAPASVPSGNTVTVTATAGDQASASVSATITISPSPAANFFVSPSGSDSNNGSFTAPFATIARAQQAVQGLLAGATSSIVVMVRGGGIFYLNSPLSFSNADSGTAAVNVVWQSYPGEMPTISGGMRVTNWTQNGNQFTATLPANAQYFEQLFYMSASSAVQSGRRLRSRLGGGSVGTYFQVAGPVFAAASSTNCPDLGQTSGQYECYDRFQYTSTDPISSTWSNLSPSPINGNPCVANGNPYPVGDVALYSFEQMGTSKMLIDCVDATNDIIYLTGPIRMRSSLSDTTTGFVAGHRYLVENAKDDFTQAGQWFLDRSHTPWTLSYLANSGENPNTDTVIIPQMPVSSPQVLVAKNLQYVTFQGLTFEHDNFTVPAQGYAYERLDQAITSAVSCQNCQNVVFNGDIITQTSGTGIDFTTTSQNATTANNEFVNGGIYDVAAHGIRIGLLAVYSDTPQNLPQFTTVENNVIDGFGRVFPKGFGIAQGCNHDNLYANNDIFDGYSGGINIGALNCPVGSTSYTSNDVAQFNNIYNLGQGVSNDFGCVYFNTTPQGEAPPTGNQALNNVCHDVTDSNVFSTTLPGVAGYGGQGMYIDNNSGSVNIENNLVYRVSGSTVAQTCGPQGQGLTNVQNIIKNNILAFSRESVKQQGCTPADATNKLFDMTNNLIIYDKGSIQGGCFSCLNGDCATVLPATVNMQSNMYCYAGSNGCTLPSPAFFSSNDPAGQAGGCSQSTTYSSLQQWQGVGEDLGSMQQNPFSSVSPSNNTSEYSASGAASAVGFVTFDPTQAGRNNPILPEPTIAPTFPTQTYSMNQF